MKTCQKGHGEYADDLNICPVCKKEYRKDYYAKNKEKEKAKVRAWQEENRESVIEKKREYNRENKDKHHGWYLNRIAKRKYDAIWRGMIERCYNPNHHKYPSYGARGIIVCERWLNEETGYANFEADMGPRPSPLHSIDRKENNGNYEPSNVVWSDKKTQQRNRRVNANVTINEKTQCVSAWAEEIGIKRSTFQRRLDLGWAGERLLRTPDQKFNRLRPKTFKE